MRSRPDPATEEGRLVAAVLDGDRESYAPLVHRYQERLYRHALGMVGDGDVAADMVQDAFIRAYRNLRRCRNPDNFGGWIFHIVRNRCLDHLKESRRSDVPLEPELAGGAGTVLDTRVVAGETVRKALEATPELLREAFLLKHVEGLSYEEMSEMTGASPSALKMRVKRAREQLARMLTPASARSM